MTDISWPCDPRPKAPGVSSQSTCCRKPADGNTVRGCLILSVSIIPTITVVRSENVLPPKFLVVLVVGVGPHIDL